MRNIKTREYLKTVAKERGLTIEQVRVIVESPFQFTRYVMEHKTDRETLTFPSVRIPYFGVIYCPEYLKERLRKHKENKSKDG